MVKACSRPRTSRGVSRGRRKSKWHENPPPKQRVGSTPTSGTTSFFQGMPRRRGRPLESRPMLRSDFHYDLPHALIAQTPLGERQASRLLTLDGATGALEDRAFADLPALLRAGDLLVLNDTRVLPARVWGRKPTGGRVECLVERALGARRALAHLRASHSLKSGAELDLAGGARARVVARAGELFEI